VQFNEPEVYANIAFITGGFGTPGMLAISNFTASLAHGFAENGKSVEIICTEMAETYPVPANVSFKEIPSGDKMALALQRHLHNKRFDAIILTVMPAKNFEERIRLARRSTDKVLLFSGETLERKAEGSIGSQEIFDSVREGIDGVIVMTKMIKNYWKNEGNLKSRMIYNVGPVIREDLWQKPNSGSTLQNTAMYFGNVYHEEVFDLIAVSQIVSRIIPSFRLTIYGDASKDALENFKKAVSDKGMTEHIEVNAAVQIDELAQLQQRASILLMPSRNWERANMGFPNKLGEYMLSRRPIVASKVGGISCWVNRRQVIFSPPDDINFFAKQVIDALQNPEKYTRMTDRAYTSIEKIAGSARSAKGLLGWIAKLRSKSHQL